MSIPEKSETELMLEAGAQTFTPPKNQPRKIYEDLDDDIKDDEVEVAQEEVVEEPEISQEKPVEKEAKKEEAAESEPVKAEKTEGEALKQKVEEFEKKEEEYKAKIKELEEYREENKKANKAIVEAFQAEPVVAEMMKDIVQGLTLRQAINKYFDPSDLTVEDGDPDEDDIKKVIEERKKSEKERENYFKTIDDNKQLSQVAVNEFVKENDLKEKDAADFFNKVDAYLIDAYNGKLTKDFFILMKKGLDYEKRETEFQERLKAEVEAAEIRIRNEKIELAKEKRKTDGDGLPKISQKIEKQEEPVKHKRTGFLKSLDEYQKRNIF